LAGLAVALAAQGRTVQPWMCLERCGGFNFTRDHNNVMLHRHALNQISFEAWKLGEGGSLVWLGMTPVSAMYRKEGLKIMPMLTSANIVQMRQIFDDAALQKSFINSAVQNAITNNYDGYDIDMEPETGVVAADGPKYTAFLDNFAVAMHVLNKTLDVDIASWGPLWDFAALAKTRVDVFHTMDTYASNFTTWTARFNKAVQAFPLTRLGIGLESRRPEGGEWSAQDLQQRFDMIKNAGIKEIDIWMIPIGEPLWGFIDKWFNAP